MILEDNSLNPRAPSLLLIPNSTSVMKHKLHRSSIVVIAGVVECAMVYDDSSKPIVEYGAFYDGRVLKPYIECTTILEGSKSLFKLTTSNLNRWRDEKYWRF